MSATRQSGSPIEFWFDFASGYAYSAALELDALAERHGRTVAWRPFTLGAAFKVTGAQGLGRTPLQREYARRDWQRLARLKGIPNLPDNHPRTGLAAIRAFYHLERTDAHAAAALAKRMIIGYSQNGLDTDDPNAIAAAAAPLESMAMRSRRDRRSRSEAHRAPNAAPHQVLHVGEPAGSVARNARVQLPPRFRSEALLRYAASSWRAMTLSSRIGFTPSKIGSTVASTT